LTIQLLQTQEVQWFSHVMGILTYLAVFGMTLIWIIGWMGISMIVGSIFKLPLKTTCLIGALLGPLGFMLTLIAGFLEENAEPKFIGAAPSTSAVVDWDPFS
jgi:cytosine/uracil/thiamine/allantoin permease